IIIIFSLGYALQRFNPVDISSVATVSIYIFLPSLVFTSLYESEIGLDFAYISLFFLTLFICIIGIVKYCAYIFKWNKSIESGSILSTAFMNGGNYALPVIMFSLGEEAMPFAIFCFVVSSIFMSLFGVYFASRSKEGMLKALKTVFKMPTTYAALLAYLAQIVPLNIPETIFSMIALVGNAAIPTMMVLLGAQLSTITLKNIEWKTISLLCFILMIVYHTLAIAILWLLYIECILT